LYFTLKYIILTLTLLTTIFMCTFCYSIKPATGIASLDFQNTNMYTIYWHFRSRKD